ncbi:MAG: hypothetical protein ACFFAV_08995 [Candidatus Hermodarchaeota archaeon]
MPIGLIIMRWNERVGTEIMKKYPEEIEITDGTLMQIYSTHEYSGESGLICLMIGSLNIASYYTGPKNEHYVILLLNIDEDPDSYEEGLVDVSRVILQNLDNNAYFDMIPSLFQRLAVYPTLSAEQILAFTYFDEVKRMIIDRLRVDGAVSKSEIIIWLKDQYKQGFLNIDADIIELIKRNIIKQVSVKGIPSELLFLINDIVCMRVPPVKLVKNPLEWGLPSTLAEGYKIEVKKYFQAYRPSETDNLRVLDVLTNPQAYETLCLLRTAIVTRNELEKLKKKGVDDLDNVLKMLWESQIVQIFRDENENEYYALLTDFYIDLMFPKYLMNIIKMNYENKSKAEPVLIEYLTILEDNYIIMKSTKKSKT